MEGVKIWGKKIKQPTRTQNSIIWEASLDQKVSLKKLRPAQYSSLPPPTPCREGCCRKKVLSGFKKVNAGWVNLGVFGKGGLLIIFEAMWWWSFSHRFQVPGRVGWWGGQDRWEGVGRHKWLGLWLLFFLPWHPQVPFKVFDVAVVCFFYPCGHPVFLWENSNLQKNPRIEPSISPFNSIRRKRKKCGGEEIGVPALEIPWNLAIRVGACNRVGCAATTACRFVCTSVVRSKSSPGSCKQAFNRLQSSK